MNNSSSAYQSTDQQTGGLLSFTPRFCLVPEALYREEDQDLWLNFLHEHIPHDQNISTDPITEANCICLHQQETSGKEEHIIAHLIRVGLQTDNPANRLLCYQTAKQLCVVMFSHGKLQLANIYPTTTPTDTLYYILNIYQQYSIATDSALTYLHSSDNELHELLNTYINTLPLAL